MKKVNFTTSKEAYQHIVLAHAFASVQKQIDACMEETTDEGTLSTLAEIDNKVSDILEKISLIIGFEMIKEI